MESLKNTFIIGKRRKIFLYCIFSTRTPELPFFSTNSPARYFAGILIVWVYCLSYLYYLQSNKGYHGIRLRDIMLLKVRNNYNNQG